MARRDRSASTAQHSTTRPSTQAVLYRVAQERADHQREVRHLSRRARAFNARQAGRDNPLRLIPTSQEVPVPLDAALIAAVDRRHPFDLPWARIDRAVATRMLSFPGRPDTEPLDGADLVASVGFQNGLGLGGLKADQMEDDPPNPRFGSGADQLSDASSLGVDVVRQFGVRDMLWGMLTNAPKAPDDATGEVGTTLKFVVPTAVPVDEDELENRLLEGRRYEFAPELDTSGEASNIERLGEQLAQAFKEGVRLCFTFLTLGGGSGVLLDMQEKGVAVDHENAATTLKDFPEWSHLYRNINAWPAHNPLGSSGLSEAQAYVDSAPTSALRLYWSPDHLDPLVLREARRSARTWAAASYALASLDFRFSFQRAGVRSIASHCAGLLGEAVEHARALLAEEGHPDATSLRLEDVLEGIELFNECDLRTIIKGVVDSEVVDLVEDTADMWARGVVMAALGFIEGFRDHGLSLDHPPLFLPGLSSYSAADVEATSVGVWGGAYYRFATEEGVARRSWTWRALFLDRLCQRIAATWAFLRGELYAEPYKPEGFGWVPTLSQAFRGVDLHWYHFTVAAAGAGDLGALHAGWLVTEVAQVSGLLAAHGFGSEVTVFESTASEDEAAFQVFPDGTSPTAATDAQREAFQASDAWRRLLAARAAGAAKVSWHPMIENPDDDNPWKDCGLRDPTGAGAGAAEDTVARTVYFAYHRVGLLMRDTESVGLIVPTPLPARDSLLILSGAPNDAFKDAPLLVFELRGLGIAMLAGRPLRELRTAAYVFLVDPTTGDTGEVEVVIRPASGSLDGAIWLEPFPDDPAAWRLPSTTKDALPRYALDASITLVDSGFSGDVERIVTVRRGDPPRVLLSPCILSVELRATGALS